MPVPSDQLKQIIDKAMTDAQFRDALIQDPSAAVKQLGVQVGPQDSQNLANIASNIKNMLGQIKGMIQSDKPVQEPSAHFSWA